jgi:hypothetical protein
MKVHANAALGPAGRLALVRDVEAGRTLRAAAAARNVAPATAHRWWHRWLGAIDPQHQSGAWLLDRSSRPHRQPRRLSSAQEEPILRARRETGLGPGRLAGLCRRARSTIWKVLRRHGSAPAVPWMGRALADACRSSGSRAARGRRCRCPPGSRSPSQARTSPPGARAPPHPR